MRSAVTVEFQLIVVRQSYSLAASVLVSTNTQNPTYQKSLGYWSYGNPALTCAGADSCQHNGDVIMIQDLDGGGKGCRYTTPTYQGIWPWYDAPVTFCCQASAVARVSIPELYFRDNTNIISGHSHPSGPIGVSETKENSWYSLTSL